MSIYIITISAISGLILGGIIVKLSSRIKSHTFDDEQIEAAPRTLESETIKSLRSQLSHLNRVNADLTYESEKQLETVKSMEADLEKYRDCYKAIQHIGHMHFGTTDTNTIKRDVETLIRHKRLLTNKIMQLEPKRDKSGKFVSKNERAKRLPRQKPMWGGELSSNPEQLKPRPISSLKPTEAIIVTNDAERDAILKLMDAEGWEWNSGETAKEVIINNSYPYALAYKFEGTDGFSNKGIRIVDLDYDWQVSFFPASDFLPTEPKAEQTTESKPTEQQIDWTKPQPFPDDYVVPRGTKVVSLIEYFNVQIGEEGVCVDFDRTGSCRVYDFNSDGEVKSALYNHQVAPLDPTDHPLHPEFKEKGVEA